MSSERGGGRPEPTIQPVPGRRFRPGDFGPPVPVAIPGTAARHALELMRESEYPELIRALSSAPRKRKGRGYQCLVSLPESERLELAEYLEERAEVERMVAAYGDGADHSIARACDVAARRLREAGR